MSKKGIWIDEEMCWFNNDNGQFENGDFIGIGITIQPNSQLKCFATSNGKLLGKIIEKYMQNY
jgi:hypothetical protein